MKETFIKPLHRFEVILLLMFQKHAFGQEKLPNLWTKSETGYTLILAYINATSRGVDGNTSCILKTVKSKTNQFGQRPKWAWG